jgi:NAD(P)H-quinone oxidoreductase subunit 2
MRPLQLGIVASAIITSLAGILSNPLFTLSASSVASTPILHSTVITQEIPKSTIQVSTIDDLIN